MKTILVFETGPECLLHNQRVVAVQPHLTTSDGGSLELAAPHWLNEVSEAFNDCYRLILHVHYEFIRSSAMRFFGHILWTPAQQGERIQSVTGSIYFVDDSYDPKKLLR